MSRSQPAWSGGEFAAMLRRLRQAARPPISLRELARMAGCSHVYIWQLEHGEKPVTMAMAWRLDKALCTRGALIRAAQRQQMRAELPACPTCARPL